MRFWVDGVFGEEASSAAPGRSTRWRLLVTSRVELSAQRAEPGSHQVFLGQQRQACRGRDCPLRTAEGGSAQQFGSSDLVQGRQRQRCVGRQVKGIKEGRRCCAIAPTIMRNLPRAETVRAGREWRPMDQRMASTGSHASASASVCAHHGLTT